MEEEEAKKIVESLTDSITSGEKKDIEESTKDIVKKAALAVSSLKETEFDIRFNPDVFRFVQAWVCSLLTLPRLSEISEKNWST